MGGRGRWKWIVKRGEGKAGLHDLMMAIICPHWIWHWELRYRIWVSTPAKSRRAT